MKRNKLTTAYVQVTSHVLKTCLITFICTSILVALMFFTSFGHPAYASEGGSSSFTPGAQGDFAMNYYPPGLYFRENIVYTDGKLRNYPGAVTDADIPGVGTVTLPVNAKLKSTVWFDLVQILYSSNLNILGGRYFANINIPIGFDADLKTHANIPAVPGIGLPAIDVGDDELSTTGLGDIQAVPFGIVWDINDFHILAAQNLILTTGRFDPGKLTNMGRNYFSYDEVFGVTWLDQKQGHEVSFMAGYMINTKNQATEYKTGDEFHVDYTIAQYLSKQLGFGIVGYYYQQMKNDKNPTLDEINTLDSALGLPSPGGYKSKGAAVGPAIMFTPNVGGKDVNIIAKWLYEYYARNRLKGDWVWLSAVVKF
jgi:hypothetical protein